MAIIQHWSHAIEAKTVKVILFHPIFTVGQQKMNNFIFSIVKAKRIPCRMFTTGTRIEILVRITGKVTQPFYFILHCMGVNDVHDNSDAHAMGCVNEFFQFVRSTEAGRSSKETWYVISETAVIWMLLNSHNLDTVISILYDAWKNLFLKLSVTADFFLLLRHTDMTFINQQWISGGLESFLFHLIRFLRRPYLCAEDFGLFILNNPICPCRNTFAAATVPMHH